MRTGKPRPDDRPDNDHYDMAPAEGRIDRFFTVQDELRGVSRELEFLARAFAATGNERMADQLFELGESVKNCTKAVGDYQTRELNDRIKQGEQATQNMLAAALGSLTRH